MKALLPKIVLAEDSPDDEFISRRAIAKCDTPCELIVLRDGTETLEYLMDSGSSVALAVLDYNLPGKNGKEILAQMRQRDHTRFTPVVIFSGSNNGSALAECYLHGANSCVRKPDNPAQYIQDLSLVVQYWLSVNHSFKNEEPRYPSANAAWDAAYATALRT
jgi:CheY-like chemotaxis protein